MKRYLGHAYLVITRRDSRVQVGQHLTVIQPGDFGHHAIEQIKHATGFRHEGFQSAMPIYTLSGCVLVQHFGRAGVGFLLR